MVMVDVRPSGLVGITLLKKGKTMFNFTFPDADMAIYIYFFKYLVKIKQRENHKLRQMLMLHLFTKQFGKNC